MPTHAVKQRTQAIPAQSQSEPEGGRTAFDGRQRLNEAGGARQDHGRRIGPEATQPSAGACDYPGSTDPAPLSPRVALPFRAVFEAEFYPYGFHIIRIVFLS